MRRHGSLLIDMRDPEAWFTLHGDGTRYGFGDGDGRGYGSTPFNGARSLDFADFGGGAYGTTGGNGRGGSG